MRISFRSILGYHLTVNVELFSIDRVVLKIDLVSIVLDGLVEELVVSLSIPPQNVRTFITCLDHFLSILAHTVARRIIDDIEQGKLTNLDQSKSGGDGLRSLAQSRQVRCVSYDDWKRLDAHETSLGLARGKPREKIVDIEKMLQLSSSISKKISSD